MGGGIYGNVTKEPYPHYSFMMQLPCGPENVDKLLAAADVEIKKLKENGPSVKDLDKVKSQWHEKYVTDMKENKFWVKELQDILFEGHSKDRMLHYDKYVNELTPAEIQQTAKVMFDGKNQFVSVLYPETQK